jgi:hypothetical protein
MAPWLFLVFHIQVQMESSLFREEHLYTHFIN